MDNDLSKIKRIEIREKLIKRVAEIAESENTDVYIVGGYVRDHLLGRERKDFDFTVVGDSIEFAKKVAERLNSKAIIYERFRTALVPVGETDLEFVGTRKEEYEPGSRNPKVTNGTFEDDIKRRDFTINALAVALNGDAKGKIVDLFSGIDDLAKEMIRTPLNPTVTFSDDPLRMMRAARFASQLGFEIAPEAYAAMKSMAERIKIISRERITDEFLKIIDSGEPSKGLKILYYTGILKYIFADLHKLAGVDIIEEAERTYAHKDVFFHSLKVLDNAAKMTNNTWLRFAALVHDIAKPVTKRYIKGQGWTFHGHEELGARRMKKIFREMKFPLDQLPYVETLVRLHQRPMVLVDDEVTDSAVRRLAVQAGSALKDLFTLVRADITTKNPNLSAKYLDNYEIVANKVMEVQEKDKLREFQSPVRGEEIMEICELKPSRAVGFIKDQIEEAILEGEIPNEYEPARNYFLEHKNEWLEIAKKKNYLR